MANQATTDKKDKSGGDVTKAEVLTTPVTQATQWDLFNAKGPNSVGGE